MVPFSAAVKKGCYLRKHLSDEVSADAAHTPVACVVCLRHGGGGEIMYQNWFLENSRNYRLQEGLI